MANVQYYDVIIKPVITEQSMNAMAQKTYTFYVHTDANKSMIKEAVEKMVRRREEATSLVLHQTRRKQSLSLQQTARISSYSKTFN